MTSLPENKKLAIAGGVPVRDKLLPYGRQSLDATDIDAVVEVLKSDWLTTGPRVGEFEERFAARVGAQHAISFSSGTAALHGTAFAAKLGSGDEAITTPMTFCATANCILYQGAKPIFADVSMDTLNLDPVRVLEKLTSRTKAIFAVDYAGHPAALDELQVLARNQGALLIEDASHALGAVFQGERVGSIADMTVFSFHPVKHIATGEGGMVTTNDSKLAETLRRFRNHGISSEARQRQDAGQWFYEMVLLGFNYRLTDIACALGISQLGKLDENLRRRREVAAAYTAAFRDLASLEVPAVRNGIDPAWHLYPIRLRLETLSVSRSEVFQALRAENIGVNVHYVPVHLHPYYRDRFGTKKGDFPVAENAYECLISLPMFHGMSREDLHDTIEAVLKVASYYQVGNVNGGRSRLLGARG